MEFWTLGFVRRTQQTELKYESEDLEQLKMSYVSTCGSTNMLGFKFSHLFGTRSMNENIA